MKWRHQKQVEDTIRDFVYKALPEAIEEVDDVVYDVGLEKASLGPGNWIDVKAYFNTEAFEGELVFILDYSSKQHGATVRDMFCYINRTNMGPVMYEWFDGKWHVHDLKEDDVDQED